MYPLEYFISFLLLFLGLVLEKFLNSLFGASEPRLGAGDEIFRTDGTTFTSELAGEGTNVDFEEIGG